MSEDRTYLPREEGALRIMEALSAADEELLERSGMPAPAGGGREWDDRKVTKMSTYKKKSRALWKYGSIGAACLVFLVVGAVSWNSRIRFARMIWGGAGAENSSASGSTGGGQYAAGGVSESVEAAMDGLTEEGNDYTTSGNGGATGGVNGGAEAPDLGNDAGSIPYPADNLQIITEEQARASDSFGSYIPRQLPAGYAFESALMDDQGQLYLCWSHGVDTIRLSFTFAEAGEFETADVSRPEAYDVRLYEIPYGATVPEEYRETFDNPIFLAEDLSPEVVSSRMKSYEDSENTDTLTGRFSVLYPEGILVWFDGNGTAEEIWNMFASL